MTNLFKLLQPLQFIDQYLKSGVRPDGRKFTEFRDILLTCDCISTANGSALIKLGTSSVICGINTSVVKPSIGQPDDQGILDINVKFSNTCSNDLDNPDRVTISDLARECIKKVLYHANVLNLPELCLIPKKFVWKFDIEIICLNLNGSIVDASLLAVICALERCKLQKYEIDYEFDLITPTDVYENLKIQCYPVLTTFCMINKCLLADPILTEEELSDSLIRIAVDPNSKSDTIFFLEITGSVEIEESLLKQIYKNALDRATFVKNIIAKHSNSNGTDSKLINYESMKTINTS